MIQLHKILVVTDFAPATGAALAYGRELARTFGAQLHLLHVTENPFLRPSTANPHADHLAMFRALHERFTARDRAALSPHVAFGLLSEVEISRGDSSPRERQQESASFSFGNGMSDNPADAITEYANAADIDLIVMGTTGRGGMAQLLVNSVRERVVRTARCPVLIVKHPEHEFRIGGARPGPADKGADVTNSAPEKTR